MNLNRTFCTWCFDNGVKFVEIFLGVPTPKLFDELRVPADRDDLCLLVLLLRLGDHGLRDSCPDDDGQNFSGI